MKTIKINTMEILYHKTKEFTYSCVGYTSTSETFKMNFAPFFIHLAQFSTYIHSTASSFFKVSDLAIT
jgi:hypothetical protein